MIVTYFRGRGLIHEGLVILEILLMNIFFFVCSSLKGFFTVQGVMGGGGRDYM